ncbi:hypothetical protein chiPu_0025717, partial [Chiloscyllium punctatum]|nr:hypothetical protein [Chiloscyllium punctatum]
MGAANGRGGLGLCPMRAGGGVSESGLGEGRVAAAGPVSRDSGGCGDTERAAPGEGRGSGLSPLAMTGLQPIDLLLQAAQYLERRER